MESDNAIKMAELEDEVTRLRTLVNQKDLEFGHKIAELEDKVTLMNQKDLEIGHKLAELEDKVTLITVVFEGQKCRGCSCCGERCLGKEIEAELYAEQFELGMRCEYKLLPSKINLPEDSELPTVPEPPPEEGSQLWIPTLPRLRLPRLRSTRLPRPRITLLSQEERSLDFALKLLTFGWTAPNNWSLPFQGYVINYFHV